MTCCYPELVRVFWPGVVSTDTLTSFAGGVYSGTVIVQDLIDTGILYILPGLDGSDLICSMLVYGSGSATMVIGGNTIKPSPIPTFEFVGGRPSRPIAH